MKIFKFLFIQCLLICPLSSCKITKVEHNVDCYEQLTQLNNNLTLLNDSIFKYLDKFEKLQIHHTIKAGRVMRDTVFKRYCKENGSMLGELYLLERTRAVDYVYDGFFFFKNNSFSFKTESWLNYEDKLVDIGDKLGQIRLSHDDNVINIDNRSKILSRISNIDSLNIELLNTSNLKCLPFLIDKELKKGKEHFNHKECLNETSYIAYKCKFDENRHWQISVVYFCDRLGEKEQETLIKNCYLNCK